MTRVGPRWAIIVAGALLWSACGDDSDAGSTTPPASQDAHSDVVDSEPASSASSLDVMACQTDAMNILTATEAYKTLDAYGELPESIEDHVEDDFLNATSQYWVLDSSSGTVELTPAPGSPCTAEMIADLP